MTPNLTLREIATHPISTAFSGFAVVAHLITYTPVDAVAGVLWGNIASLFTVSSLFAFTIAPNIGQVNQQPFIVLALVFAAGFALKILFDVYKDYTEAT